MGGGVKGRLGVFQKNIQLGKSSRPLVRWPALVKIVTKFKKNFPTVLICWNDIEIHQGFLHSYLVPPLLPVHLVRTWTITRGKVMCQKNNEDKFLNNGWVGIKSPKLFVNIHIQLFVLQTSKHVVSGWVEENLKHLNFTFRTFSSWLKRRVKWRKNLYFT